MKSRIATMDSLRALSALAVVVSHTVPEHYAIGHLDLNFIGDCGVILFFVLSAYLITKQLLNTKPEVRSLGDMRTALSSFYANRALRLLPAFYATLLIAAALNATDIRDGFWWYATFLTNIYFAIDPETEAISAASHLWTIALEWQFYLIWPLLILWLPRRVLPWMIAAVWLFGLYSNWPGNILPEEFEATGIPWYVDSLATGAMLAYAQHAGWKVDRIIPFYWPCLGIFLLGIGLLALGPADYDSLYDPIFHLGINLVSVILIWKSVANAYSWLTCRILEFSALSFIGMISYSVYLHHYFIIDLYPAAVQRGLLPDVAEGPLFSIIVMVLAVLTASLSWFLIEKPVQDFRKRKFRKETAF